MHDLIASEEERLAEMKKFSVENYIAFWFKMQNAANWPEERIEEFKKNIANSIKNELSLTHAKMFEDAEKFLHTLENQFQSNVGHI